MTAGRTFPPLGEPIPEPPPNPLKGLTPIPGRPNWYRDRRGDEKYVEPPYKPA